MSKIDYDLKKIKAIALDVDGVLSPSTIPLSETGEPLRMGNVKDGYALQLASREGLKFAIITGGFSQAIENRCKILGIKDVFQRAGDKLPILKDWMETNGLAAEEVAYMGDDIPDLPCLRYVGLPCCPHDATWEVKETARYISPFGGGYGAVRDLVEQVMRANGKWISNPEFAVKMIRW